MGLGLEEEAGLRLYPEVLACFPRNTVESKNM
jgi:hypothetical protein